MATFSFTIYSNYENVGDDDIGFSGNIYLSGDVTGLV